MNIVGDQGHNSSQITASRKAPIWDNDRMYACHPTNIINEKVCENRYMDGSSFLSSRCYENIDRKSNGACEGCEEPAYDEVLGRKATMRGPIVRIARFRAELQRNMGTFGQPWIKYCILFGTEDMNYDYSASFFCNEMRMIKSRQKRQA
ncbi:jg14818 [Pararge aegeria aegeria]|uniref:Jg14818 protein n=1 Tax=Pararge aegeria aegeria TaxID=348720 RepID=A0A8S4QYS6_9NEOP|nr:jg14818 [Pararge aegeria aegeria]